MGAKKQIKSRRKTKAAKRRKARRHGKTLSYAEQVAAAMAIAALKKTGVDVLATGRQTDPRMNLTLQDIKAQYPWLAEIGKVFR